MPRWTPEETWAGKDVYIIGGGPSLRGFDWTPLRTECTIGCNTAFTLGAQVCKICFFGDSKWFKWKNTQAELAQYSSQGGVVFTSAPSLQTTKLPWLWVMSRESKGLHEKALGWNGNTGASAINLALILGAKRVLLMGFDMGLSKENQSNWHTRIVDRNQIRPEVYRIFQNDFKYVVGDWKKKFADREIVNLTKMSGLPSTMFPWVDPDVFWSEKMNLAKVS